MVLKKLGGLLNNFDSPGGLLKLGATSGQGIQKLGSQAKFNIGEKLSGFSPFEKTNMKISAQAYRPQDERADEVDGFRYLSVLSTDELAVYIDTETRHLILGVRGTVNFGDAITDIRLLARNAESSPRFNRNAQEFVDILNETQPSLVTLTGHSLGGAVAIFLFNQFYREVPFNHLYLFNPAIVFNEILLSGFNDQLVEKSTVYRSQQDIVSVGSAFSNFETKTLPLKKKDFLSGHKLEVFERILKDNEV